MLVLVRRVVVVSVVVFKRLCFRSLHMMKVEINLQ